MSEKVQHHGRAVKRIREILHVKQDTLAMELGISQQSVSTLETKETIDPETLEQIAKILKIPVEGIKNFTEEAAINIIASNHNGKDNSSAVNFQCTFNPLDKYVEAMEENKKLYERLLQTEREKVELLERMLNEKKK